MGKKKGNMFAGLKPAIAARIRNRGKVAPKKRRMSDSIGCLRLDNVVIMTPRYKYAHEVH